MSSPQVNPLGGIWPLGKMTMTAGTPKSILINVGSQAAGGRGTAGTPDVMPNARNISSMCTQITFSTPSTNTADVFVQDGNYAASDTNRTVLAVPKGQTISLPYGGETQSGALDPSRYYVDGTTNDVVYVFCSGAA